MIPKLSTHALDIARGIPAQGLRLRLYRRGALHLAELLLEVETDHDGRTSQPLLSGRELIAGVYEIVFEVGVYFARQEVSFGPPFLDEVPIRFGISDATLSYHVPLLFSPWAYSTYRGS